MSDLLPCPFCGGNLFVNGLRIARCDNDDCFMRAKMTVDLDDPEQIDAWNTRADLPRPQDAARIAELEAENARLRGLLHECADDLRSYVDTEYPETMRAQYPSMQRRWTRDMELVFRVRAALAADSGAAAPTSET